MWRRTLGNQERAAPKNQSIFACSDIRFKRSSKQVG
jgi:hypothetical protein